MKTVSRSEAWTGVADCRTASMIASLEKNPANPGMPADEIAPSSSVQ